MTGAGTAADKDIALGEPLRRSRHKIERALMEQLVTLTRAQPWLEKRQDRLLDLFDLCDVDAEQDLLSKLLHDFFYVTNSRLNEEIVKLADVITGDWKCHPERTKIVAIAKSSYVDSSQLVLYHLKPALAEKAGWSTASFISKLGDAVAACEDGDEIVLIEEFVGSGTTIGKAVSWLKTKIVERGISVRIHLAVITAMTDTKQQLAGSADNLYAGNWLVRGISDNFVGHELASATTHMEALEGKLCDKAESGNLKKYRFGYKRTEALYCLENGNVPNNVFPVFWWKWLKGEKKRSPLLARMQ